MTRSLRHSSNIFSRRSFLAGSSVGAILALSNWPGAAAAQAVDADSFLTFSKNLVGKDRLDNDVAAAMFKALDKTFGRDPVAGLINGEDHQDIEADIIAAWYNGVSPDPDDLDVLTYTDALMWDAMTYTKPMGYCGGSMGYWSDPPVE